MFRGDLRMDDRKRSFPLDGPCGLIGSDVAPIVAEQVVYCGTEQQVREGFAIALRAMGIDTGFLPGTLYPPAISLNTEDN